MTEIAWPFDARHVHFKLRVRVAFSPVLGQASISVPWIDGAGEFTQPINTGPLSSLAESAAGEASAAAAASSVPAKGRSSPSWSGAVWAEFEKDLGGQAVTEKLMRALQHAAVPISVQLSEAEAAGTGKLHLGPLLLANDEPLEPPAPPPEPVPEKGGKAGKAGAKADPAGGGKAGAKAAAKKAAAKPQTPVTPPQPQPGEGEDKDESKPKPPKLQRRIRSNEVRAVWTEAVGIAGLHRLEVSVSTDQPVLSPAMLKRFLPVCFTVETLRDLPNENALKDVSDGVFVEVRPRLGTSTSALQAECSKWQSTTRPHDTCIRFSEPVVWLLGLLPLHCVREWMMNEELIVEVHDRELRNPGGITTTRSVSGEEIRALTHPHGIASFNLSPLLDSHNLQVSLRAEVAPQRGNKKRRNAELSREPLRVQGLLDEEEGSDRLNCVPDRREVAPEFARHSTTCVIIASLAVPLPPAKDLQKEEEKALSESWAANEVEDGAAPTAASAIHRGGVAPEVSVKHGAGKAVEARGAIAPFRAKVKNQDGEAVTGPWRRKREEAEADEAKLSAAVAQTTKGSRPPSGEKVEGPDSKAPAQEPPDEGMADGLDCQYERFGRAVLVFNDKDTGTIKTVLETLRRHNGEVLGIDPASYHLDTRVLTEEECSDPYLDLVTGFMILDGQIRLAVLEGLRGKGLQKLLEAVPGRGSADGPRCKVLQHRGVGFGERLYAEFGPLLKQIKVRTTLEKLASKPELYCISVPCSDEVLETMQAIPALTQLCRLDRLHMTRQGILYPEARHLRQLEILYGDFVTDGELEGGPPGPSTRMAAKTDARSLKKRLTLGRVLVDAPSPTGKKQGDAAGGGETLQSDLSLEDGAAVVTQDLREALTAAGALPSRRAALDQRNEAYESTLKMRASGDVKDFISTNRQEVLAQSLQNTQKTNRLSNRQNRETPFMEGREVHMYSGQKLNCTEIQKAWMRQEMLKQEDEKHWSYAPVYLSQNFELTEEGAESGVRANLPQRQSDTYANKAGDTRPPWRAFHPRPPEAFRKPPRELPTERREDLHEPFVENEWRRMPLGEERQKAVAEQVRFEPDKLPHKRRIAERPFDPARAQATNKPFGPQGGFQSVHYHGRKPGESCGQEVLDHNIKERAMDASKIRGERQMRTFSQGATRSCVTDMDRHETVLKPVDPKEARKGITPMDCTLRHERFQEFGRPDLEFQCRMRENHASPPYDVRTGGYVPRDPHVGTKEASLSGKLGKAPWRHGAANFSDSIGPNGEYISSHDFDVLKPPPTSLFNEEHVVKNASRSAITSKDRSKAVYKRPKDFGASHVVQPAAA